MKLNLRSGTTEGGDAFGQANVANPQRCIFGPVNSPYRHLSASRPRDLPEVAGTHECGDLLSEPDGFFERTKWACIILNCVRASTACRFHIHH